MDVGKVTGRGSFCEALTQKERERQELPRSYLSDGSGAQWRVVVVVDREMVKLIGKGQVELTNLMLKPYFLLRLMFGDDNP